jgi:photosystem I subunit 8
MICVPVKCFIPNNFIQNKEELNFMSASYLPSILVPLVGLVFPAVSMIGLFLYIEQQQIN